jgi:hypothetical protein
MQHWRLCSVLLQSTFLSQQIVTHQPRKTKQNKSPVKNRARTIADAVRSTRSQQTSFDFNVIVVDPPVHDQKATPPRLTNNAVVGLC